MPELLISPHQCACWETPHSLAWEDQDLKSLSFFFFVKPSNPQLTHREQSIILPLGSADSKPCHFTSGPQTSSVFAQGHQKKTRDQHAASRRFSSQTLLREGNQYLNRRHTSLCSHKENSLSNSLSPILTSVTPDLVLVEKNASTSAV